MWIIHFDISGFVLKYFLNLVSSERLLWWLDELVGVEAEGQQAGAAEDPNGTVRPTLQGDSRGYNEGGAKDTSGYACKDSISHCKPSAQSVSPKLQNVQVFGGLSHAWESNCHGEAVRN